MKWGRTGTNTQPGFSVNGMVFAKACRNFNKMAFLKSESFLNLNWDREGQGYEGGEARKLSRVEFKSFLCLPKLSNKVRSSKMTFAIFLTY